MQGWVDIKGFEGLYQVDVCGKVRNPRSGLVLQPIYDKNGYQTVILWKGSPTKAHCRKIHRLVADAFIPNPANKLEVNHLNGDRADNRRGNLEWATSSENKQHAILILGRKPSNSRPVIATGFGKVMWFESMMAAHRAGFNRNGIHACLKGIYSHHQNYKWSYANG